MLTREQVEEQYEVDVDGVITSLGKFEGDMWWAVAYYELWCDNLFDEDIYDRSGERLISSVLVLDKDDLDIVMPDDYDLDEYIYTMYIHEDDQGFVHIDIEDKEVELTVEERMDNDGAEGYERVFYLEDDVEIEEELVDLLSQVMSDFPEELSDEGYECSYYRGVWTITGSYVSTWHVGEFFGQGFNIAGTITIEADTRGNDLSCYASFCTDDATTVGEALSGLEITSMYHFSNGSWGELSLS